jgi:hypothetical protein
VPAAAVMRRVKLKFQGIEKTVSGRDFYIAGLNAAFRA